MRGFQPGKARAVPQNYADGGVVSTIKGMLGFGGGKKKPEPLPADLSKMPPTGAGPAASQPEPPKKAISQYSGMSALERRMKEQGLADGGLVRGPGTGISDDIEDEVEEGTFVMPADSTEAVGPEMMDQAGKAVPVRLSNGETKLPPEALQAIGAEVMEAIKEVTHTPAAKQSRGGDERMGFADGGVVRPEDRPRTIADLARSPGYGGGAGGPVNMPARPQVQPQVQQRPVSAPVPQPQASQPAPGVQRQGNSYTATTIADRARSPAFGMGASAPAGMPLTRPSAAVVPQAAQPTASAPTIASQVQRNGNSFSAAPAAPKPSAPLDPQAQADRAKIGSAWDTVKGLNDDAGRAIADVASLVPRGLVGAYDSAVVRPMRAAGVNADYLSPKLVPDGVDPSSMTPFTDQKRIATEAVSSKAGGGRGFVNPDNVDPNASRPTSTVQAQPQAAPDTPKPNTPPQAGDAAKPGAREVLPGIYRQGNSYGDSPEAATTGARPSQGPGARNNSIAEALATRSTGQQGQPTDVMGIYARTSEAMKGVAEAQRALDDYGPRMSGGGDLAMGGRASAQQFQQDMQRTALMKQAAQGGRGGAAAMQALNNMDGNQIQRETAQMREQGDMARFNAREAGETTRAGMRSQADARRDGIAAELGRGQLDLQRNAQGPTMRAADRQEKLYADYDAAKTPEERATIAQKIRDLSGKNSQDGRYQLVRGEQVYDDRAQALRNTGERLYDTQSGKFVGGGQSSAPIPMPKTQDELKAGQVYETNKGPATWDGKQFTAVAG